MLRRRFLIGGTIDSGKSGLLNIILGNLTAWPRRRDSANSASAGSATPFEQKSTSPPIRPSASPKPTTSHITPKTTCSPMCVASPPQRFTLAPLASTTASRSK
jgi:hypothetical protein